MEKLYATGPLTGFITQYSQLESFKKRHLAIFKTLSPREKQVLALVAKGHPNPEVAKILNISRITVQNHRSNIRQKLSISKHNEYFNYALAFDLISF